MRIRSFILQPLLAGLPLAAAMSGAAHAQFVGDAFFVEPSVTAAPGGEGAVQVALFAGTQAVGAAQVTVTYDPKALEVLGVDPVEAGRITTAMQWRKEGNVLHIVMVNGASLSQPIGTVPLGKIRFKALGAVGETTELWAKAIEILKPNAEAIPPGLEALKGDVTVAASTTTTARIAARSMPSTEPSLVKRALGMRPAGGTVTLQVVDGAGQAQPVQVQIPPAAARRE